MRPLHARGHVAPARRASARTSAGRASATARAVRRSSRGGRIPRRVAGRARPRTGLVFCFAATSGADTSAGATAQPSRTPGRTSSTRCPPERPRPARRSRGSAPRRRERELAIRHILEDGGIRSGGRGRPALSAAHSKADPGRVLVVGDRVEELRAKTVSQMPLEVVHIEPVLVERHRDDVRLEAAEGHDRAEIRRCLDHDEVATVEERLADELETFH